MTAAVHAGSSENPLLVEWNTPFESPPFESIGLEHYRAAFEEAMERHERKVRAIHAQQSDPTFENTIAALDRSGGLLDRVSNVFFAMTSSMTNDDLQAIAKDIAPKLSQHRDEILLNEMLFQRIESVHDQREELDLTAEQEKLLREYYKDFVRGGANLPPKEKERLKEINSRLSVLSVRFGENVLKENNRFELVIDDKADLAGLPDTVIAGASETAKERGHEGKWVFTLHKPSMIPFLQYSEKRSLREKIYRGYINRGNHNDELDNKEILSEMAALRVERAKLLGYDTHAHYVLEDNMAKRPAEVYELLRDVWKPGLKRAKQEVVEMQQLIDEENGGFDLASWDWWYYAEKLKQRKYKLDEEMLRPYFKLDNVLNGAFEVANRLFGLTFHERTDIPVYHDDVTVFQVKDADGRHLGILYVDYFPRASKRGGAWMGEFRQQFRMNGEDKRPIIYN
ncbi:MAG: M3 family metallopeptidase, partial [bacterium]